MSKTERTINRPKSIHSRQRAASLHRQRRADCARSRTDLGDDEQTQKWQQMRHTKLSKNPPPVAADGILAPPSGVKSRRRPDDSCILRRLRSWSPHREFAAEFSIECATANRYLARLRPSSKIRRDPCPLNARLGWEEGNTASGGSRLSGYSLSERTSPEGLERST